MSLQRRTFAQKKTGITQIGSITYSRYILVYRVRSGTRVPKSRTLLEGVRLARVVDGLRGLEERNIYTVSFEVSSCPRNQGVFSVEVEFV